MQQQYTMNSEGQDDNENLRSYIHKYTRLHREATGKPQMRSLILIISYTSYQG